ncbi:unnamed protein product [Pylaiella littoralis]
MTVKAAHLDDLTDKYTHVFLQQARETMLQEGQATEARRAARARQLAINPPQVYNVEWDSSKPFPHSTKVATGEGTVDIAQELAGGGDTNRKRQLGAPHEVVAAGEFGIGTNDAQNGPNQSSSLISLPAESTLVDAAATFRMTSDVAASLAVDGQPTGKPGVNPIGEILRHGKLRRLEKVVRMAILRRHAPAATETFMEQATMRDLVPTPGAPLGRETRLATCTSGLTEDQEAELEMMMGTRPLDFRFLQRCRQNTEAGAMNVGPRPTTVPARGAASSERLVPPRTSDEVIPHIDREEPDPKILGASPSAARRRTVPLTQESGKSKPPRRRLKENNTGEEKADVNSVPSESVSPSGKSEAAQAGRQVTGHIRPTGTGVAGRGLKAIREESRKLLRSAKARSADLAEFAVLKSAQAYVAAGKKALQLAAEQLNDERRFMKQDDFVLHASDGDVKNVRKGLAEKRLCSVKGTHKEKGHCAFFAAGLSLITVESELRLANRDRSHEAVYDLRLTCPQPPAANKRATEQFRHHVETLNRKRDALASVLELLLEEGSDPGCRQGSNGPRFEVGWSLLHHFARVGDHARLLWLLHHGAQVDPVDHAGTTPLLLAAAEGRVTCVTALLTRGADIRHRGPSGQTALHCAASGGGALVARTLVAAGADPGAPDDKGRTPVDLARTCNRRATVDILTLHRHHVTPASILLACIVEDELGDSCHARTPTDSDARGCSGD